MPWGIFVLSGKPGKGVANAPCRICASLFNDQDETKAVFRIKRAPCYACSGYNLFPSEIKRPFLDGCQEGILAIGRKCEDLHIVVPVDPRLLRFILFEHTMEVAAAKPERAHYCPAGMLRPRQPRAFFDV